MSISPAELGFKPGRGFFTDEGYVRAFDLPFEPTDKMMQELARRFRFHPGDHSFCYRLKEKTVIIMAAKQSGLEDLESGLMKLVDEIEKARRIQKLAEMAK